jgi:DNA-binding NtrC family response regulator
MTNEKQITIFIVDDDPLFLKNLEIEFTLNGDFHLKTFASGELCLENLGLKPDIIILDYYLDGMNNNAINGLETLIRIKATHAYIPVIMLSSQDKIEVAVNCMHHDAFDYVVKSETAFLRLRKNITSIFKYKEIEKTLDWYMDHV